MKKLFLISTVVMLSFSSCKKNSPLALSNVSISGTTWTGTVNIPGATTPILNAPMNLSFNAGGNLTGTIVNSGVTLNIAGTWIRVSVMASMSFTLDSFAGTYSAEGTLTTNYTKLESGVMTNATTPTGNGTFTMTKN